MQRAKATLPFKGKEVVTKLIYGRVTKGGHVIDYKENWRKGDKDLKRKS